MKAGKREMLKIFKEDMHHCMRSSMMSGKTQIILDLAKKTSRKTLIFAPSTSEV